MDDDQAILNYENNIYLYKILYLVRTNLPSSEYLYIIMFFLKYLGLILFSNSLNKSKDTKEANDLHINDTVSSANPNDSDNLNNKSNSSMSSLNIQSILSKLLINGNGFEVINKYYAEICVIGFCILIVYILLINYGIIYMRKKYYNKNISTITEKKIKKINNNSKFEKTFFKIMTYFFFFIVFFHQYIIEYYIFGFLGHIFYLFGLFDSDAFTNYIMQNYSRGVNEYFNSLPINSIVILIINCITIVIILILFIQFMILNTTKTLFLNIGIPLHGNIHFLIFKIIVYNYNPVYGFIRMFGNKIILIVNVINLIVILIIFFLSFRKFSFYPSKLSHMCVFVEFFSFFSIISDIIVYLTNSEIDSTKFRITKLIMVLFNSIILTFYIISKKEEHNLNIFANNLFSKTFKDLNPSDIYYYIEIYNNYAKNKRKNYVKIFRIIQTHVLLCNKKDCPGGLLIPKSISYSFFTNFSKKLNDDNSKKEKISNKNNNFIEDLNDEKNVNSRKSSRVEAPRNSKNSEINNTNISNKINKDLFMEERMNKKRKMSKSKNTFYFDEDKKLLSKQLLNMKKKTVSKDNFLYDSINPNFDNSISNNNTTEQNINVINEERKLKDEHFQMIGEQEIINRIHFLYKSKNYGLLEKYIFIHLQYLMKIKQNYRLALYFVGKYSQCGINFSFYSKYFLYEIKKYITKNITHLNNVKVNDPYIVKYRQENISMKKLVNYLSSYSIIKRLLITSCEKILYFYNFRSELHNSLSLQKYIKTKIYPIINSAEDIKISIYKLKLLIEQYNREEKHPIQSIELCYLITNFFKLIEGKIPEDILKNITPIFYFRKMHYEKIENEFHNFMISNPLIIYLTKKDSFNICYFTNVFQFKLGYNYSDLKNQDFHEKIFPGRQELIKEHSIMMKQFLFYNKNDFTKEKTFIKSKEGYLIPINLISKIYPNFSYDFFLIANITFNSEGCSSDFLLQNIENNKKTNNINSDKITNVYSFLLNYDFDFLGMTKNFFLEYDLNQNMLRELRLNFCQFFCVDENILIDKIHKEKNKLIKNYPNLNHKILLKESNKAFSIFQNISIENTFKLRDITLLESYFVPSIHIYDKIDKKKLIIKIPELINIIDEIGLDYDWYVRLLNFKERLINNNYLKNESDINNNEKNSRTLASDNKYSSAIDQIKYESNMINMKEQFFEVIYSIKKLGSLSYYVVNLLENIDNNLDQSYAQNNNNNNNNTNINEVLNKIGTNEKKNSKKKIKYNKYLSAKTLEILNEEGDAIQINKRKSKTNNNSPMLSSKKPSIIIGKTNKKLQNNYKNEEKEKEKEKKYISKINNRSNKDIEDKKEGKDKDNSNISELNERKNVGMLNENNYIKKNKMIKKDHNEEEENSPLLSKEQFNDILKKDKKRNIIFIIAIYAIIFIALIINIIKFTLSIIGFEASKNVLKTTIYLEMLKIDIYVQGILSIIYCINENEQITDILNIHSEAKLKIKSTLDHLKILQNQINIIVNLLINVHIQLLF